MVADGFVIDGDINQCMSFTIIPGQPVLKKVRREEKKVEK